jgi:hypothetical protein
LADLRKTQAAQPWFAFLLRKDSLGPDHADVLQVFAYLERVAAAKRETVASERSLLFATALRTVLNQRLGKHFGGQSSMVVHRTM